MAASSSSFHWVDMSSLYLAPTRASLRDNRKRTIAGERQVTQALGPAIIKGGHLDLRFRSWCQVPAAWCKHKAGAFFNYPHGHLTMQAKNDVMSFLHRDGVVWPEPASPVDPIYNSVNDMTPYDGPRVLRVRLKLLKRKAF